MQITRRQTMAGLAALAALPFAARAQDKPIRLLVGFPAGGGTDAIGRLLRRRCRPLWAPRCWSRTSPAPAARSRPRR